MKYRYTLICFVLFPLLLSAQQEGDKWFTFGASIQGVALLRTYNSQIAAPLDDDSNTPILFSPGLQLGFNWRLRPLWELIIRGNYTRASKLDDQSFRVLTNVTRVTVGNVTTITDGLSRIPVSEGKVASHRSIWMESLYVKSLLRKDTQLDWQGGVGLSYIIYRQMYRSSLFFNHSTGSYGPVIIRNEKISKWGLSLLTQLRYRINSRLYLETQLGGNIFFNRSSQIGFTLSGAYRINS
jgi:hypothetical protein